MTKDEYITDLIIRIIQKLDEYPESKDLTSAVLTGSLGRDEPTFNDGVLKSDVELALVYKDKCKHSAEIIKEKLIKDFDEDMNPMTISEDRVRNKYNFNYSFKTPEYSSIFMYDFFNGSKTIWGTDLLKGTVVQYDPYEAKRIVANRIGELVYLESTTHSEELKKQ